MAVFPGLQVNLTVFWAPANIGGGSFVLYWPPEEGPAAKAGHGAIMDMLLQVGFDKKKVLRKIDKNIISLFVWMEWYLIKKMIINEN